MTAKILVVEDEALIADDLERTLGRLGYDVPAVLAEGSTAVEAAGRLAPSLVLMDIKLRGAMDGIAAAAAIRERFQLPVVFLTSHSDSGTLARAGSVRPAGYVTKPFSERELRVAIELALHTHRVERELATKERFFQTTLESVGDAVVVTDAAFGVLFVNPTAASLLGVTAREVEGRPLAEVLTVVDESGRVLSSPAIGAALERRVMHAERVAQLLSREGRRVQIDASAAPILGRGALGEEAALLGVVTVFRDVGERRALESRVARAERLASLGTMAAGICHEINNPLTAILASLECAGEVLERLPAHDGEATREALSEARMLVGEAREGAARVGAIVEDMRFFARPGPERSKTIDVRRPIDEAIKLASHVTRQHARIERRYTSTPLVTVDPGRLTQIVVNLLTNAAQALEAGRALDHTIEVRTGTTDDGGAYLEVSDDGPGVPEELLPRIFEPFVTTKTLAGATSGGLGLGLAICASLAEGMRGTLTARNEPSRGATFRLELPAAAAPRSATTPLPPRVVAPSSELRGRVLVVDDEEAIARVFVRLLGPQHDVTVCSDGREALERIARGERFDVVVCDLMMPNVGGIEVFETARRLDASQAARFVFTTGGSTNEASRVFLESCGCPTIDKPFDANEVRALVAHLVTRARPS